MNKRAKLIPAIFAVVCGWPLSAQTVKPAPVVLADSETAVMLTPFEVSTSKDVGYQATETLAGTRSASTPRS